jgi:hypothetical protein
LSSLDPAIEPMFLEADVCIVNPSIVYARVGKAGLLSRQFHLHPFMVRPRHPDILPLDTVDSLYIDAAVDDISDVLVIDDSDRMVAFCLDTIESFKPENAFSLKDRSRIAITANWASHNTTLFHRKFVEHKCRIHARPLDSEWKDIEERSDKFIESVLALVNKHSPRAVKADF